MKRRVQRFDRSNVQLSLLDKVDDCRSVLFSEIETMLANNRAKQLAYTTICHYLRSAGNSLDGLVMGAFFDGNHRLHGFYLAEQLSRHCAGLYCAVNSRAYRDGTEWMDVEFFRTLRKAGFKTLLLGGSETDGVHQYIQKLLPTRLESPMLPLVYRQ